jgi:hypothetical protein
MGWTFDPNGGLATQSDIKAPTYKDPFVDFLGSNYYDKNNLDPALAMTLNAGRSGGMVSGIGAFLPSANNNDFQAANSALQGGSRYNDTDMKGLAKSMGIDVGDKSGADLENTLNSQLKDYVTIGGMSAGWNPTGDPRQANGTLYKRENGQLVPYQTTSYSAPETSHGFIADHPGILMPLAVVGGGLLAGAAGFGAGASAGAGEATAAGASGAGGAGTAGLSGSIANALGLGAQWGALPAWGQAAITGAAQGGLRAGLGGGNIIKGMAMGGLTGGLGSWAGPAISGLTGLPGWAGSALGSAGIGGLTGGWKGALGAGLGSLANTGLGGGALGQLGSRLTGMGLNAAFGGGSGGSSGGSGPASGASNGLGQGVGGATASGGSGGTGLAGLPMPALGAAQAQERAWLQNSYAPVAQEAQRKKLAEDLQDEFA